MSVRLLLNMTARLFPTGMIGTQGWATSRALELRQDIARSAQSSHSATRA